MFSKGKEHLFWWKNMAMRPHRSTDKLWYCPLCDAFHNDYKHVDFGLQIFAFLICMGVILAIGNTIWETRIGRNFRVYLPWDELLNNAVLSGFLTFWSYIIILNTVVPISLYVRYGQKHSSNSTNEYSSLRRNTQRHLQTKWLEPNGLIIIIMLVMNRCCLFVVLVWKFYGWATVTS